MPPPAVVNDGEGAEEPAQKGYDAKMAKKATGVFLNPVEPLNRGRRSRGRRVIPILLIGLLIIFAVLALV